MNRAPKRDLIPSVSAPIFLFFYLLLLLAPLPASANQTQNVKIGVLAKRGSQYSHKKWSLTADYLSSSIEGCHFEIIPLGFSEIHTAIEKGEIAFVLANPAFYVELEKRHGVSRIATLINRHIGGQRTTTFGGVIFTRSDRHDISTFNDLKGRSFMAVDSRSFGGWITAWYQFEQQNFDPFAHFSVLQYGSTHDAVVHAVLRGTVDAGTVRTDTLERMAVDAGIDLAQLKIINQQQITGFPFLLSTNLYPEWPMAAVRSTPNRLARQVASALLAMEEEHPAALASKSAGWTIPLNYQDVHDCLLKLKIAPYKDFGKISLADVLVRFWKQISLVLASIFLIIAILIYILRLNRSLTEKKQEVEDLNSNLEAKVIERTKKVDALLDQELYLREIMQTVADINELLITSPNVEHLLTQACLRFTKHSHYGFSWIGLMEHDAIVQVYSSEEEFKLLNSPPYYPCEKGDAFFHTPTAESIVLNKTIIDIKRDESIMAGAWHEHPSLSGFVAEVCLPLRAEKFKKPFGALSVYTLRKEGFEAEEVAMLEELAGDIGFAVHAFNQRESVKNLQAERTANYEETILSFVNMIEHRDTYTAGHTSRVGHYSELIARQIGLSNEEIRKLQKASILHDIGKIATPDSVLLKPGKLSSLEYDLIKMHAVVGYEMLSKINMYKDLAEIVLHHHERHDGAGYPHGLKGEKIPLLSRIMSVADAFDAMTTNRIYKPRKSKEDALLELESLSGSQFSPQIIEAASQVLPAVIPPGTTSQLPGTELEKRRFSYFFNDRLTGLFNEDYLQIVLQNNRSHHTFRCIHNIHLENLEEYNKEYGWEKGNRILQQLAIALQERFPEAYLFRAYGNDFSIILRQHLDLDPTQISSLPCLQEHGIIVHVSHHDLDREKHYVINKLERLEVQMVP